MTTPAAKPTAHAPPSDLARGVANRIVVERVRRRLTQTELAARLRVGGWAISQNRLSSIERGEQRVTVDQLAVFAFAFGVPPGYLLMAPGRAEMLAAFP